MGHVFSEDGINPDPAKIKVIGNMPIPNEKEDLQRFLGMVNYQGFLKACFGGESPPPQKKNIPFIWR